MRKLKIYIDESGDFGFTKNSSLLYVVSFVFIEENDNSLKYINIFNEKLNKLGYTGMIHTANLIAKRNEHEKMAFNLRKQLFWNLFYYARRLNIKIKSVIVDKKYLNNHTQLTKKLTQGIEQTFNNNKKYFDSFSKIEIYYDDGQPHLKKILDKLFTSNKYVRIVNFPKNRDRLFQITDMFTAIDKLYYKYNNKMKLTNNEKYFLKIKELEHIQKIMDYKRLN